MNKRELLSFCTVILTTTGCGAIDKLAEEATEELLEEALEAEGIEEIEFDSDGNTVIINEDGEKVVISVDGDKASIEITDADGESIATVDGNGESFVIDDGEGNVAIGSSSLADGWPAKYPLPDGVTVISSLRSETDGKVSFLAQFEGELSYDEAAAAVRAYGNSPTVDQESRSGGSSSLILGYELDNGAQLSVILNSDSDSHVVGTVTITDWVE